jgi:hypothetical protein
MNGSLLGMLGEIPLPVREDAILVIRADPEIPQRVFDLV